MKKIITESTIVERIKNNFDNNLPCSEVFFNELNPEMIIDHTLVDNYLTKNTYKKYPKKTVRVDLLVPTQQNLDSDKLPDINLDNDTGAILFEKEDLYYIVDGHHRIAKNILNGNDSIVAYVKESSERLNEEINLSKEKTKTDKKIELLTQGYNVCCDDLEFGPDKPKLHLINDISYTTEHKSFAAYSPSTKEVFCVIANRNTADCMRSIAHELMHHKQNLENRLYNGAGEDGTDIENEANSYSGKIMRRLGREIENIFEDKEKITESNSVLKKSDLLSY